MYYETNHKFSKKKKKKEKYLNGSKNYIMESGWKDSHLTTLTTCRHLVIFVCFKDLKAQMNLKKTICKSPLDHMSLSQLLNFSLFRTRTCILSAPCVSSASILRFILCMPFIFLNDSTLCSFQTYILGYISLIIREGARERNACTHEDLYFVF